MDGRDQKKDAGDNPEPPGNLPAKKAEHHGWRDRPEQERRETRGPLRQAKEANAQIGQQRVKRVRTPGGVHERTNRIFENQGFHKKHLVIRKAGTKVNKPHQQCREGQDDNDGTIRGPVARIPIAFSRQRIALKSREKPGRSDEKRERRGAEQNPKNGQAFRIEIGVMMVGRG